MIRLPEPGTAPVKGDERWAVTWSREHRGLEEGFRVVRTKRTAVRDYNRLLKDPSMRRVGWALERFDGTYWGSV